MTTASSRRSGTKSPISVSDSLSTPHPDDGGGAGPAAHETASPLVAAVTRAFEDTGALARGLSGYEPRPGQQAMAAAVAAVIDAGGTLLAEAGTGTGKTLAYLIPSILSRQRALISTGTKNLQEQ